MSGLVKATKTSLMATVLVVGAMSISDAVMEKRPFNVANCLCQTGCRLGY